MKQINVDCAGMENSRQLHRALAEALAFPEWYRYNLDALHDCLTDLAEETCLTLTGFSALPGFSRGFRRAMEDAQEENPNLTVIMK